MSPITRLIWLSDQLGATQHHLVVLDANLADTVQDLREAATTDGRTLDSDRLANVAAHARSRLGPVRDELLMIQQELRELLEKEEAR